MTQAISGATIFDGEKMLQQHSVIIDDQKVVAIVADQDLPANITSHRLNGGTLTAGFIDLQVNGGGGVLFNNTPTLDSLNAIIQGHLSKGVTAILPTLVSDEKSVLQAGINAVRQAMAQDMPGIIGVHIEGPFFNMERRGVHNQAHIRPLSQQDIDWLCSEADIPMMLTLAPEQTSQGQIKQLADAGITVCAGHSNGLAQDIHNAVEEGLSGFTHLYNAMRPVTGREPGVVGSALLADTCWCGIIVDNHHVHADCIKLAHRTKPLGKLYLVSDAMATIGSENKSFTLYGETIHEEQGRLLNSEGKLAGSAIGLIDAVRISHQDVGLELSECLNMASRYPAEFMQISDQYGRIAPGYSANMVYFNEQFEVQQTWLAGQHHFHNEGINS